MRNNKKLMFLVLVFLVGITVVAGNCEERQALTELQIVTTPVAEKFDTAQITKVLPVTWEPCASHLTIEGKEAQVLYNRIKAGDYPTLEELQKHPVVAKLDVLADYYKKVYGNTADINTSERNLLRKKIIKDFLSLGSARTESFGENGMAHYVYDGALNRDYEMELVLGLPASGKSTMVCNPDSEVMGAFIMDCNFIKSMFPEYKDSHGCAADALHAECYAMMKEAINEFTEGNYKGINVILPVVITDFDEFISTFVVPFENAGYNVRVKLCDVEPNESVARVVARALDSGQLINSSLLFSFGYAQREAYKKIAHILNAKGVPYGCDIVNVSVF